MEQKEEKKNFKFNRIALIALMLVLFDGFIMGGPGVGFFASICGTLFYLGYGVWHYSKDKILSGLSIKKAGIFLLAFFGIAVIFKVNTYIGKSNAKVVIAAVQQFHEDTKAYPEELEELVPKYLSRLPKCAFRLNDRYFHYYHDDKTRVLVWSTSPPYGRQTYNFLKNEWGYID